MATPESRSNHRSQNSIRASGSKKSAALATLKAYESVCIASVLEDCADQLAILGAIMPGSYEARKDAKQIVKDEIGSLVDEQKKLEGVYEDVMTDRVTGQGEAGLATKQASHGKAQLAGKELTNSTNVMLRSLKQNPLTMDNLSKVQDDRGFLENVVIQSIHELKDKNTYHSLVEAVKTEKIRKQRLQDTIKKEEEGRKYIKNLREQLVNVGRDKESEIQMRMEMIAHLKDQLQEMKAKTSMEKKYIKKVCNVSVLQTQKMCNLGEKDLKDQIDRIRSKLDEETRCHEDICQYLMTHQGLLETKLEYWIAKYEKDTEEKARELDVLKSSKAKDLERLQELTKLYAEYEQVVVEDRIEKEKVRRKHEQEAIELKAAIRLEAWWRGVMSARRRRDIEMCSRVQTGRVDVFDEDETGNAEDKATSNQTATNTSRRVEISKTGELIIDPVTNYDNQRFACWVARKNTVAYVLVHGISNCCVGQGDEEREGEEYYAVDYEKYGYYTDDYYAQDYYYNGNYYDYTDGQYEGDNYYNTDYSYSYDDSAAEERKKKLTAPSRQIPTLLRYERLVLGEKNSNSTKLSETPQKTKLKIKSKAKKS
ncbi:IQCG [Bugula neritina]|uniref:IQCG n=1 Tax=Bugula neritina TaxID=10212 RepID=A0A7J7JMA3_BUGNE|nr:IQCG [Bugula neritina]